MTSKNKRSSDMEQRKGEIWEPATYLFFCPVCDKSYSIVYDASSRQDFNGRYERCTCLIATGQCRHCSTDLTVAYSADLFEVVAYDTAVEERWNGLFAEYSSLWKKLKKVMKKLKRNPGRSQQKKKDSLKKACKMLARQLHDSEEQYALKCDRQRAAREQQESTFF